MNADFDIAVIGSGFGGSIMAMIARRLGHSVILLERGQHPRFVIGESSTPLANLLLEELARQYDLPRLLPLAKWGSWQKSQPQIFCVSSSRRHTSSPRDWSSDVCSSDLEEAAAEAEPERVARLRLVQQRGVV